MFIQHVKVVFAIHDAVEDPFRRGQFQDRVAAVADARDLVSQDDLVDHLRPGSVKRYVSVCGDLFPGRTVLIEPAVEPPGSSPFFYDARIFRLLSGALKQDSFIDRPGIRRLAVAVRVEGNGHRLHLSQRERPDSGDQSGTAFVRNAEFLRFLSVERHAQIFRHRMTDGRDRQLQGIELAVLQRFVVRQPFSFLADEPGQTERCDAVFQHGRRKIRRISCGRLCDRQRNVLHRGSRCEKRESCDDHVGVMGEDQRQAVVCYLQKRIQPEINAISFYPFFVEGRQFPAVFLNGIGPDDQRTEEGQQRIETLLRGRVIRKRSGGLPAQTGGVGKQLRAVLRRFFQRVDFFHAAVSKMLQIVHQRHQLARDRTFAAEDQMAECLQALLICVSERELFAFIFKRDCVRLGVSLPRRDDRFELAQQICQHRLDTAFERVGIIGLRLLVCVRVDLGDLFDHFLRCSRIVDDVLPVAGHAPGRQHRDGIVVADIVMDAAVFAVVRGCALRRRGRFEGVTEHLRRVRAVQQAGCRQVRDGAAAALSGHPKDDVAGRGQFVVCRKEGFRCSRVRDLLGCLSAVGVDRHVLLPSFVAVLVALEHDGDQRFARHCLRAHRKGAVVGLAVEIHSCKLSKAQRSQECGRVLSVRASRSQLGRGQGKRVAALRSVSVEPAVGVVTACRDVIFR